MQVAAERKLTLPGMLREIDTTGAKRTVQFDPPGVFNKGALGDIRQTIRRQTGLSCAIKVPIPIGETMRRVSPEFSGRRADMYLMICDC